MAVDRPELLVVWALGLVRCLLPLGVGRYQLGRAWSGGTAPPPTGWSICAVFWFHPGVWFVRRMLMCQAEHAADDTALAQGTPATDYAQILVDLARDHAPAAALAPPSSSVGCVRS